MGDPMENFALWILYSVQIILPAIWGIMIANGYVSYHKYVEFAFKRKYCKKRCCWIFVVFGCVATNGGIVALMSYYYAPLLELDCTRFFVSWINPVSMLLFIGLLFSKARYPNLLYGIILIMVYWIGHFNEFMCTVVLNVVYLLHSFMVPVYIILIFFAIKELATWKYGLISMYLVSFDVITNLIVIYYFFQNGDYFFAALQILFTFLGHTFGSISNNLFGDEYENLSTVDKILSFMGFGRIYFRIKSWSEVKDDNKIYTKLATKQRIWGMMFESFPSIVLHVYAYVIAKQFSLSLVSSIVVSCISISYNVWLYMIKIIYTQKLDDSNNSITEVIELELPKKSFQSDDYMLLRDVDEHYTTDSRKSTFIPSWCGDVMINTNYYMKMYLFMISDFYIRSIPLICLMAIIPWTCNDDQDICVSRNITFCILFGSLLIFEFVMNKRMRIKSYASNLFILQIFSVSLFSSFYNLLASLDILRNDRFFGKSVEFRSFMFEHKCRIVLSVLITTVNIPLLFMNESEELSNVVVVLVSFYVIFLIVNVIIFKSI